MVHRSVLVAAVTVMVVMVLIVAHGRRVAAGSPEFQPLASAARLGALDVMTRLLDAGADPNLPDAGGNHWTPLMHAVHKHQTGAVRLLLARGAHPDGPAGLRMTPLMMAIASGQTETARLLLDRGADPRRRTPDGASLLTLAVSGGALTDIDEPLLGGCHSDTVLLLRERAPELIVDRTLRGRIALFFSWLNGCKEVKAIVNRSPATFVKSR